MNTKTTTVCEFCGGEYKHRYYMDEYKILQCDNCGTGKASPPPAPEMLRSFYRNFLGRMNPSAYAKYKNACAILYPEIGLKTNCNLRMLDFGGGGGFFSKAFEDLGYGGSTYVDIDPESCRFAREELSLEKVITTDGTDFLSKHEHTYDFIYCRHVIEHLINPTFFLSQIKSLLNPQGLFLLQFPNAKSLEYLAYTELFMPRFNRVYRSSNLSKFKLLKVMISGGILHGMDPPRHLWAITGNAIENWAADNGLHCKIAYADIGNKAYSPGYHPRRTVYKRIQDYAGRYLLSRIKGGTHLVAKLSHA